jgi:minor extracellular serine protease Vpr
MRLTLNVRLTQLILLTSVFAAVPGLAPLARAAQPYSTRWVVMLNDPPIVEKYPGRIEKTRAAAEPYHQHLLQVQSTLRSQIQGMNVRVTGAAQHVLNALFVVATPAQAEAIRHLSGVKSVTPMRQYHKADQLTLSNVQAAWSAAGIGGQGNAGAGLKIGIIDTGIDQTNPSFNDSAFTLPSGYPLCYVQSDCDNFTNKKVIVARSYVSDIIDSDVTGTNTAAQDRPDDLSARDLDGHGTGVASVAAGVTASFNGTTISGVAPMAYLGNYKIFGSDEVNPNGSGNILQAVDDAVSDGMDIINLSLGGPGYTGPLDTSCDGPCDTLAYSLEEAVENGEVVVVAAAGNEGNDGYQYNIVSASTPTLATVGSPAYAPSVIAAGGIQNDVTYVQSVTVSGSSVPSDVQTIPAVTSADGPESATPITAPLVDVTNAGDSDGLLCNPITPAALTGDIALILRGTCDFGTKIDNAQNAGAVGVILIDNGTGFYPWSAGSNPLIPAFLIGQTEGQNLKGYIDSNSGARVTMSPYAYQVPVSAGYQYVADKCVPGENATPPSNLLIAKSVACFASLGPVSGVGAVVVKPDVSAAATDFLLAAENYDPEGELFEFPRYGAGDGTSFSTPMLSGSAALVLQANPNLSPLQIKSALVNTGSLSGLVTTDGSASAPIGQVGTGLLQTQNAVISTVQAVPSSVAFGPIVSGSLPLSTSVAFYNSGTSSVTISLSVAEPSGASGTQIQVNNATTASVTIAAGNSTSVTVSLSGSIPSAGRYEGLITATGGPTTLYIPYQFLVSDNTPFDIIPLNTTPPGYVGFDGPIGATNPWYETVSCTAVNSCVVDYGPIAIQVIDRYGAPVANAPVSWSVTQGNGSIMQGSSYTDSATDANGIAGASVVLGSTPGYQEFTASVNNLQFPFDGYVRLVPAIGSPGVVDAATFSQGKAVAPGSWIAIYGTNLSDVTDQAFSDCPECSTVTQPLPMGLDGVAFSFDISAASYPGRFNYVSPTQLNVQVPWELQGQTSAQVKVMVNYTYSTLYTLPIAEYSPGFFVIDYTTKEVAALDQNNNVVTSSSPVARGTIVQLFLNGLGPVNNQPNDGQPGPNNTSATTKVQPTITIGGQTASIQYSGLAPGFVGLYQVNATVPSGIGTGSQNIVCSIGGVTSATATLTVK